MNEIIPIIPLLVLCLFTFLISKYWLDKDALKNKIKSYNDPKIDFRKLVTIHIKGIKIGSQILIFVIILKIIYILL
jgi:hypothetical protein